MSKVIQLPSYRFPTWAKEETIQTDNGLTNLLRKAGNLEYHSQTPRNIKSTENADESHPQKSNIVNVLSLFVIIVFIFFIIDVIRDTTFQLSTLGHLQVSIFFNNMVSILLF